MATKISPNERAAFKPLTRQGLREAKRTAQQTRKKKASGLPWAVRKGIVSSLRVMPPGTLGDVQLEIAERLARLTTAAPGLWNLTIDWSRYAADLDHCAHVHPVERKKGDESKNHARISAALKKAAGYLRSGYNNDDRQPDPLLYGTIEFLARQDRERFDRFHATRWIQDDEPRLSDFLLAVAKFIEGEDVQVFGLHKFECPELGHRKPKQTGEAGAAVQSADNLTSFFRKHTGKPHPSLVNKIVAAYFPGLPPTDQANSVRKRSKHGK